MSKFSKRIVMGIALSLMAAFSSIASAACTTADVAGSKWRIYTMIGVGTFDYVAHCFIAFPSTATIGTAATLLSTSSCKVVGVASSLPVTGRLTMSASCAVAGNIAVKTSPSTSLLRQIDAWVSSPGKDSLVGRAWDPHVIEEGGILSGVKQQ